MRVDISKLPYRRGVQAYIVNNKDELLLINNNKINPFWKPPSGGMERNETPEQTVKREMKEELGVKIEIIRRCSFMNAFFWHKEIVKLYKYKFKGQKQHIMIVKIKANQKIKPNRDEVGEYKWVSFKKLNKYLKLKDQQVMAKKVLNEYYKLKKTSGEHTMKVKVRESF